jgi:hypothetical protein
VLRVRLRAVTQPETKGVPLSDRQQKRVLQQVVLIWRQKTVLAHREMLRKLTPPPKLHISILLGRGGGVIQACTLTETRAVLLQVYADVRTGGRYKRS